MSIEDYQSVKSSCDHSLTHHTASKLHREFPRLRIIDASKYDMIDRSRCVALFRARHRVNSA